MRRFRDYLDPGRVAILATAGTGLALAAAWVVWLFS